jgi:hypothetical protein
LPVLGGISGSKTTIWNIRASLSAGGNIGIRARHAHDAADAREVNSYEDL